MKGPDLSCSRDSEFSIFSREYAPAHSGPELATCVPDSRLAQELARELLTEQFELSRFETHAVSSMAGIAGGIMIGLARR